MNTELKIRKNNSSRFNAFDFIIILILLSVIVISTILIIRTEQDGRANGSKEYVVYYKVRLDDVNESIGKQILNNQYVFGNGKNIGTVYKISAFQEYNNYAYNTENIEDEENNEGVAGDIVQTHDKSGVGYVIVTIKATAVYNDVEGYVVGGERIAIGKTFDLQFPNVEIAGVCTDLRDVVDKSIKAREALQQNVDANETDNTEDTNNDGQ